MKKETIKYFLDQWKSGYVSIIKFGQLMGTFSFNNTFIATLSSLMKQDAFHGFLCTATAISFLQRQKIGTYMYYCKNCKLDTFYVSYVNSNQAVSHFKIIGKRASGFVVLNWDNATNRAKGFVNVNSLQQFFEFFTAIGILQYPFTSPDLQDPAFYGVVPLEEAENFVREAGVNGIIIRTSTSITGNFAISLFKNNENINHRLESKNGKYVQKSVSGESFAELKNYQHFHVVQILNTKMFTLEQNFMT